MNAAASGARTGRALLRWRAFASLAIAVALCSACRRTPHPASQGGEIRFADGRSFAVAADLQRDTLWHQVLNPGETNDAERTLIVREIAKRRPGFVAIAGDLVGDGSSAGHWADFDDLVRPLEDAKIPVIAALGNHEYWLLGRRNEDRFFERFPILAGRHWYSVAYGELSLIVLDSNMDVLTASEWHEQRTWLDRTLERLDGDARVRGVIVVFHHPPYTNSTVTGDEAHVQQAFVPPFERSHKTMAMISGHVHSYERFVRGAKTFIVSGGGGIPRVLLLEGEKRRHPDDLYAGPAVRGYHFLAFTVGPAGIDVQVVAVGPHAVMDAFTLRWP
jgi:Icc-related predicted phosphoesterase